ncbi:MAG: TatD family hydrolase [Gammaproteobacteria bacterium]
MPLESPRCIDIHSHHRQVDGCFRIISLDARTFESDVGHDYPYSLGLHPWYVERQDCDAGLRKIQDAIDDNNMLAVGECGLDNLTAAPLSLQESVFRVQLQLAERAGKPVMIHCVRLFNELLRIKKTETTTIPWIVHGFNAKPRIAEQLLARGCYLSFGKALLQDGSNAQRTLRETPLNRFFLETDEAEGALCGIYRVAAEIKRLDLSVLTVEMTNNFNRVFLYD